jgi:tetratricopeptide (TPR) repeat protein
MLLAGGVAHADPLGDAKSGLAAFNQGDNPTAIKLFTSALDSGRLTRADQELAYVKRAEAYLAASDGKSALTDANHALDLDPRDSEALATRDRAQNLIAPPPPPGPTPSEIADQKVKDDYAAAQAKYEAQKKADADAYAQQLADYDAKVRATDAKHEADLAAWRADVAACKGGDQTKCASTAATPPPAQAQVAPPPAKPVPAVTQQTAKPAPTPTQQTAKAAPTPEKKPTVLPPLERPAIL